MNKFICLTILLLAISVTSVPRSAFAQDAATEELRAFISLLLERIAELQNAASYGVGNVPMLVGVSGPKTVPAGDGAYWNQVSKYKQFALKDLRWSWGDGSDVTSDNSHVFSKSGTYNASVQGLDQNGKVISSTRFTVTVTKPKKYAVNITNLDTDRDYVVGSTMPVSWTVDNSPGYFSNISLWVGFILINVKTKEEIFVTDAYGTMDKSTELEVPDVPAGKYKLKVYMYGTGTNKYPFATSDTFDILEK